MGAPIEQLALFSPRQAPARPEPLTIFRSAVIDGPDDCYRWELRRWWATGPYVCWIMLNPSTADAEKEDPTLRTIIAFTRAWGYGGLAVVNLYPFRSPYPRQCRAWIQEGAETDVLWRNGETIEDVAAGAALVIAAWGATTWAAAAAEHATEIVLGHHAALHCLGKTADGSPKHPLARGRHRVPATQKPIVWSERI